MVGESDVPLTEDVVKRPPKEFSATFMEWAADNVEQVIINRATVGTVFTVPINKTLFITSCFVEGTETANASTHGHIFLVITSSDMSIISTSVDHVTGQHGGNGWNSLSFTMPLKIQEKESVTLGQTGLTTPSVRGGFTGFLLDKKISIR